MKGDHIIMRCQVNLSDEMVERVDLYAKKMGVSRSSLCSILIGQGIMTFDKSLDILTDIATDMCSRSADNSHNQKKGD